MSYKVSKDYPRLKQLLDKGHKIVCWVTWDWSLGGNDMVTDIAEAEGWDINCPFCGGTGECWFSDEIMKLSEEWRRQDPPTGEGYQLWMTTNEGAPISPVFSSMEELAKWCETGATIFGSKRISYEEWLTFFQKECEGYEFLPGMIVL